MAGSCDDVIALYTDPDFYPLLDGLPKIARPHVVGRTEEGGRITMRVRYTFVADLPAAALAVIDPDKLTWIEVTAYDPAARRSTTRATG